MSATHQKARTRHPRMTETRGKVSTNAMPAATGPSAPGSVGAPTGAPITGAPANATAHPSRRLPAAASAKPVTSAKSVTTGPATATTPHMGESVAPSAAPPAPAGGAAPAQPRPATAGYHRATFLKGFVHAWNGLVYAIRTQRNARIHAAIATLAILMGIWLRISPVEFAMVFVAITAVFIAEMFNTVAEACVDMITNTYHPLARIAKDVAAGAVLLNAMLSVVIGLLVFVPHLWPLAVHVLGPLFAPGRRR